MDSLRKITSFTFVLLVAIATSAQELMIQRYPCIQDAQVSSGAKTRALPPLKQNWDPNRVYRQAVILLQYADAAFSMDDPKTYYHELLNVTGSNTCGTMPCAADYFRDQSLGMFNVQFDVFGPVFVSKNAKGQSSPNYAKPAMKEAVEKAVDSLHIDFSPYDWDQDGEVDQIIFIHSSYGGNGGNSQYSKYFWPNTGKLSVSVQVGENLSARDYSASAEKFYTGNLCGIGTICHEYSHCLGLPDLYPTYDVSVAPVSVVDEWDLMDGGNYTAWGWSPPNFSAFERYLLGWLPLEEITVPCTITDLKPVADGGKAYKMVIGDNKFYILENRQQTGWDKGAPGKGLLIAYVDYDANEWYLNRVNGSSNRYELLHADGMDFDQWFDYLNDKGLSQYVDKSNHMNSRILSSSPYPMLTDTLEVHDCSELPMPLSNIQMAADGTISFDAMTTGVAPIVETVKDSNDSWYDLQGRRLAGRPHRRGLYIHKRKKVAL